MKKKISTAEFIAETEAEIRRQEIRELCETDSRKQKEIRKKRASLTRLASALKGLTGHDREDLIEIR